MVEMSLVAVRVELPTNTPVVLLQEVTLQDDEGSQRSLPIFVGTPEATAIAYAIQGVATPRPMTHDLMADLLSAGNIDVVSIVITELRGTTYFAEINLKKDGQFFSVSSRPSDAIALAARTEAPIYADDELVASAGVVLSGDDDEPEETEELVSQFREFINDVRPEDFTPPTP